MKETSDGSSANYYQLPEGSTELQDLISYRNMNAQIGEIFRACYRMGMVAHSPEMRDVKKIIFYAQAELKRLETLNADIQKTQEDSPQHTQAGPNKNAYSNSTYAALEGRGPDCDPARN